MELEYVSDCPICGKKHFRRYKRIDEWQIVQCTHCRLALLNPRPTAVEVHKVLSVDYGYPYMPKDPLEKRRLIEVERSRLNPLFQFRKTGALLDVGFGSGFFMAQAQESGWTVAGTEITERCVHYGRDELGLQVYQGDIAELNIPRKFDVVSFHHVLEHVPNPIAQVQASKALLRDDGLLYISVPNHLGFDSWRQKSKWNGWALPWHFCHYTPATLQRMLEWRDLRVLSIDFSRSEDFDKPWIARLRGRLPTNWQRRIFSGTEMSIIACKKIAGHTSGD